MRIGIDASNLRAGGGVTHLVQVLRAARPEELGIEKLVVWTGENTFARLPNIPWIERVHVPLLDRALPFRLYWQTVQLPKLARRSCDVLFVPGGLYQGNFRPVVTMCRNMLPFAEDERRRYGLSGMRLKLRWLKKSQTKSFRNADGVIFLNKHVQSVVTEQTGTLRGKQTIIPHGVDERFRLTPRLQKPIRDFSSASPFRILYVSIVDVYKHQWHVADAVARLRKERLPIELELIGGAYPPALKRLRAVIERIDPGEQFIHYRGFVPYADLPRHYHRTDAFVFASSCENMPNILLEAMAAGLPIACANRGPMPEILGNAGTYFDPEDPESIAVALRKLILDSALRQVFAENAYQSALSFSWQRCARETLAFIADVAESVQKQNVQLQ